MEQVFLDTDVIIDLLIDRRPFSENIAAILSFSEQGLMEAHVSALSFSNIFYIIRKLSGREKAIQLLEKLEKIVTVLPVGEKTVQQALASSFTDFEDALQNYCARSAGIPTIVTRNIKDYAKSDLAVHSPESYLRILERIRKT